MPRRGVVAAIVALTVTAPGAQQPPAPLFSARAELVVLHVTVKDRGGAYVSGLRQETFTVLEDGAPQHIQFFAAEDAPVTVGLLIDSSGSMYETREQVATAAEAFADTSNPEDEIFALAFNEYVRAALPPDRPFTSDPVTLRTALMGTVAPRGRTALHDAILGGLAYLQKGRYQRKVLVIVSDGGDNASAAAFEDVVRRTENSNAAIYTIAIVDPLQSETNPKRLRQLARLTGGEAFEPDSMAEIADVLQHIARDIRHSYTIGYVPANARANGRLRQLKVLVSVPGHRALAVRSRRGYALEDE